MNPVALAVLKTGLISHELRAQALKWGAPIEDVGAEIDCKTPEQVVEILELALQNEGMVITKMTDLDAIKEFYTTQQEGLLHLTVDGLSEALNVVYGKTRLGDIILPWRADTIEDVMLDPETYLLVPPPGGDIGQAPHELEKVRFASVSEIYFGDVKAFMLCVIKKATALEASGNGNVA